MSEGIAPVYKRQSLSASLRAGVWDLSNGVCHYCGTTLHPLRDFTVDHVVPVARGGTNDPSNLVASCLLCNISKGIREAPVRPASRRAFPPSPGTVSDKVPNRRDRYLTVAQVAERLHVHEESVRRWLRDGQLKGHLISRRAGYRIRESEVERFASGSEPEVKLAA